MKKKGILCILFLVCIICISGCKSKTDKLVDEITRLLSQETIVPEELNEVFIEYSGLSEKEKKKVDNSKSLKELGDINLTEVYRIREVVSKINDFTTFSEILTVKREYDALSENEKKLIDYTIVQERMKLNNLDRAALVAVECIQDSLRYSSSLQLNNIKIIDDLEGESSYYLVSIEYSATNLLGGRVDSYSFQTISADLSNPWYLMGVISGDVESALMCTSYLDYYIYSGITPIDIDIDKIEYYLSK